MKLLTLRWFPLPLTVQMKKDKQEFIIHLDSSIESKHGENVPLLPLSTYNQLGSLTYSIQREIQLKDSK